MFFTGKLMKLYNRQEFLALPAGVVFAKYEPCCFGAFQIKGDSTSYSNDFNYQESDVLTDVVIV
jgi:hypothetical protein